MGSSVGLGSIHTDSIIPGLNDLVGSFDSRRQVPIVQRRVGAAAHSARRDKIMEITRPTSPCMVLRYIRKVEAFDDHAGAAFL